MPAERSPLADLAYPFMPSEPGRQGMVIEVGDDWSWKAGGVSREIDVIVWGRLPDSVSPVRYALRAALAREVGLRTLGRQIPNRLRVAGVHRLRPRQLSYGVRGGIRAAIRAGALVELTSLPPGDRVLDAVVAAAGGRRVGRRLYLGSGGALVVRLGLDDQTEAVLRVARQGTPGDPAPLAETLERLEAVRVALAPRLLQQGELAGASWTVEEALPGRRPSHLTVPLSREVAAAIADFPRAEGPPVALERDLRGIADRLPSRADPVRRLAADLAPELPDLPAILRHGDLWSGNLLVDRGRLCGLIDWDAAHPFGVPGADLLQLVATELRRRRRRSLGDAFLSRPWRSDAFERAAEGYWRIIGMEPTPRLLEIAAIAWWAAEVYGTVARLPHRARDEGWLATNVDAVLSAVGY